MSAVWVYVTASDAAEAEKLGRAAVEARLAACANILGPTTAIYWWEGQVESGAEVALVLKSRQDLVPAITEKINALHSYDCPCVVALPISGGNAEYLQWIEDETQG
jgi:periplasmic divalent cation tolerance protein